MTAPLKLLVLGSCHVRRPLSHLSPKAPAVRVSRNYGPMEPIHSFGEMFQVIDILRGKKTIAPEYMHLCRMGGLTPAPAAAHFDDIDLVLIEPATWVELTFQGIAVNRGNIFYDLVRSVRLKYRKAAKIGAIWFRVGLQELDGHVQEELGAQLLEIIDGDTEEDEIARSVIRDIRATKSDIAAELQTLQQTLGRPIVMAGSVFQYMPDGRAVRWPAGFSEEVEEAARQMQIPMFDPAPVVLDYGAERAVNHDRHYSDAFLPVMGEALAQFLVSVSRR
jgi:hypothetical protein